MTASERLLPLLSGVKATATDKWVSLCPGHPDKNPSCSWMYKDGRMVGHCFSGCSMKDIVAALGIKMTDLFDNARLSERKTRTLASLAAKGTVIDRDRRMLEVGRGLRGRDENTIAANAAFERSEEEGWNALAAAWKHSPRLEAEWAELRGDR